MSIRIKSRYAAEKLTTAAGTLMSLMIPAEQRLVGALREISLLEEHQDQFSERGRDFFRRLMAEFEGPGSYDEQVIDLSEEDLLRIGSLIEDLLFDTLGHYHGVD